MKVGWRSSAAGDDVLAGMRHLGALVDLLVELDRRALVPGGHAAVDPGVAGGLEPRADASPAASASRTFGMQISMAVGASRVRSGS